MAEFVRKQRHFLYLFVQTTPKQRKGLLDTITADQVRVLSQIAHNIVKSVLVLTNVEREKLRKRRKFVHLLAHKRTGYERKKRLMQGQQRTILDLLKIALDRLKTELE